MCQNSTKNIKEQTRFLARVTLMSCIQVRGSDCLTAGLGFCATIQNKEVHPAPEKQLVTFEVFACDSRPAMHSLNPSVHYLRRFAKTES